MFTFIRLTLLLAVTLVALMAQSAEAKQITLRWTKKSVKANVPRSGKRMIDPKKKIMKVRSVLLRKILLHRIFGVAGTFDREGDGCLIVPVHCSIVS
jgi:hypothetical protein